MVINMITFISSILLMVFYQSHSRSPFPFCILQINEMVRTPSMFLTCFLFVCYLGISLSVSRNLSQPSLSSGTATPLQAMHHVISLSVMFLRHMLASMVCPCSCLRLCVFILFSICSASFCLSPQSMSIIFSWWGMKYWSFGVFEHVLILRHF